MHHFYEFAAPAGSFRVRSSVQLAEPMEFYAGAWPWRAVPPMAAPDIDVQTVNGQTTVQVLAAPALNQQAMSAVESASAVVNVLTRLCLEQLGAFADLHAGSAVIDGRLVVFPGPSLAGKSTLALQLAARGHLLGGDDKVLIGPLRSQAPAKIEGMTLGLNARVRLPLDRRTGAAFAHYVGERIRRADWLPPSIGFIAPKAGEAAAFAHRFPIAALIIPQRRDSGGTGFEPASFSDIMRVLLEQMHAPHLSAQLLIEAARTLAQTVPCLMLHFENSEVAAAAVERLARTDFKDLQA